MPTSRNTTRNKICFLCQKAEDKGNTVDDLDPTELVALEDYLNNEDNSEEVQSESDSDEEPENLVDLSFHLYARYLCSRDALGLARPSARATIGYLVYNRFISLLP